MVLLNRCFVCLLNVVVLLLLRRAIFSKGETLHQRFSTTKDHHLVPKERRGLNTLDDIYRYVQIRLPDSIQTEEISISDNHDGVSPVDVVITISATNILLLDIKIDTFSAKLDASINFFNELQQLDRTFYLEGFNAEINLNTEHDSDLFDTFRFDTFLSLEQIFPCLLNAVYRVDNPIISVAMGHLRHVNDNTPQMLAAATTTRQERSPTVEALASTQGLHFVAGTTIRSLIHNVVLSFLNRSRCPDMIAGKFYLDFRDFFLSPQEALDLGGTGLQPYGDSGQMLFSALEHMSRINGEDGLLELNTLLRSTTSEEHSCLPWGEHGMIHLQGELYSYYLKLADFDLDELIGDISRNENVDSVFLTYSKDYQKIFNLTVAAFSSRLNSTALNFGISDLEIYNLDTLTAPTRIFHPTNESYVVDNFWNFGPATTSSVLRPVTLALRGFTDIAGRFPEPIQKLYEVGFMLSVDSMEISSQASLLVSPEEFVQFPLEDVLDICCWFALTADSHKDLQEKSEMDEYDNDALHRSLNIKSLDINIANITPNITCLNCSSQALEKAVASVTRILNVSHVRATLANRSGHLMNELLVQEPFHGLVNVLANESRHFCPHMTDEYIQPDISTTIDTLITNMYFPALSHEAHDSIIFAGLLSVLAMFVAVSEVILEVGDQFQKDAPYPLSGEMVLEKLHLPENTTLIDWTNLGNSIVSWSLEEFRSRTFSHDVDAENATLNFWIEQLFELVDGVYIISFEDRLFGAFETTTRIQETNVTLSEIRVEGMNSFTYADLLNPIDPLIFQNVVNMEFLNLTFVVVVSAPDFKQEIEVSAAVQSLNVSVPIFIALDKNLLYSLKVWDFLFIDDIFPCLLSAMHGFEFLRMDVDVGNVDIKVDGLLPDTSEAMSQSIDATLEIIQSKTQVLFQFVFDFIKDTANDILATSIAMSRCTNHTDDVLDFEYVDFRQMLSRNDPSNNAYGDLFITLKKSFDATFFSPYDDSSNEPMINDKVIVSVTKTHSGEDGRIDLNLVVTDLANSFGPLAFQVDQITIENIDTFGLPMVVLDVIETNEFSLVSNISIGVREPLKISFSAVSAVNKMSNRVRYHAELYDINLFTVVLTKVRRRDLMELPVEHILDPPCWAQLFTTLNGPDEEIGFGIDYIDLTYEKLVVNVTCLECDSFLEDLPEFFVKVENVLDILLKRLKNVFVAASKDYIDSGLFDAYVLESARDCLLERNLPNPPRDDFDPMPPPSIETLETIMYFSYALAATIPKFILSSEYATYDVESFHDPLAGQGELPEEVKFMGFDSTRSNPLYPIELLSSGETNAHIVSELVFEEGTFDFMDLYGMGLSLLEDKYWKIDCLSLRLTDLDTLTMFDAFEYPGPQVIQSQFSWKKLGIQIVTETSLVGADSKAERYHDRAGKLNQTVCFSFENFNLSLSLLLAIDEENFLNMRLGSFLKLDDFLPCLLNISHTLDLTEFYATASRINFDEVQGYKSDEIVESIRELNKILEDEYQQNLNTYVATVTDVFLRNMLNTMYQNYSMSQPTCNEMIITSLAQDISGSYKGFVDLRDLLLSETESRTFGGSGTAPYGHWFHYLYELVDLLECDVDEDRCLLNDLGILDSHYQAPGALVNMTRNHFAFVISDLKIDNIDSLGAPMNLFKLTPDSPYKLNYTMTFGANEKALLVSFKLFVELGKDGRSTRNEFYFNVSLQSLSLQLDTFIKMSHEKLLNFRIEDMFNKFCWFEQLLLPQYDSDGTRTYGYQRSVGIHHLAASAKRIGIKFTKKTGTGIEKDIFTSDETSASLTASFNNFWKLILSSDGGGQFTQDWVDKLLMYAAKNCSHQESPNSGFHKVDEGKIVKQHTNKELYGIIFLVVSIVSTFVTWSVYVRSCVQKRNKEWFYYLRENDIRVIEKKRIMEVELQNELNMKTGCMFHCHNEIPVVIRYSFPLVLVGNIGLFIIAHCNAASMITFRFQVAGEDYYTNDVFGGESNRGALPTIIFAVLFQYMKQLITFALWFVPPLFISTSHRGSILYWLGALAKWSIFEVMFFIAFAVGLSISVQGPKLGPTDSLYSFDMSLCPQLGLCTNLIAQLLSQITSHVALYYHDKIVEGVTRSYEQKHKLRSSEGTTESSSSCDSLLIEDDRMNDDKSQLHLDDIYGNKKHGLYSHAFVRPHRCHSGKLITRDFVNLLFTVLVIFIAAFIYLAFHLPILSLETQGFLGHFEMIGNNFVRGSDAYSVHDISAIFLEAARRNNNMESSTHHVELSYLARSIGFSLLATLLYTTLLLIPFLHLVVLVYQWFVPITGKLRCRLLSLTQILHAYSYYEVLIVSIIILTWQLDSFTNEVFKGICDEIIQAFARYGILNDKYAQCFGRKVGIEIASYIIIVSFFLLYVLKLYVTKASEQYFRERDEWLVVADDLPRSMTLDESYEIPCKPFPVMFTDTFRWTLHNKLNPWIFAQEEDDDDIRKVCRYTQEQETRLNLRDAVPS